MSYGPPPKTSYGDQDFIKEDYTPGGLQSKPHDFTSTTATTTADPRMVGANYRATQHPSPYAQSLPYGQPIQNTNAGRSTLEMASKSMTQEDIIFMKSWRQDIFVFRFLPSAVILNAANYFYNKRNGLPHKPWKYALITGVSYLGSYWLSIGELRARAASSSLNTPFMLALRKSFGLASPEMSEFHDPNSASSDVWNTTSDSFSLRSDLSPQSPSPYAGLQPMTADYQNQFDLSGPNSTGNSTSEFDSSGSPYKAATSYEELRARNRGLIPPKQS